MGSVEEVRELICDVCRNMYRLGWVSGTGGGMSIRAANGNIVMAPSGVQKERMQPEDMFILDNDGNTLQNPEQKPGEEKPPKLSECAPLFMAAYKLRGAGAVLHSHSINAVLASLIDETSHEFSVTQLEMIKGIEGHGYYDDCVVPIIENTARESHLTARLSAAIEAYPKTRAVIVRRHGIYVWGKTWAQAKGQAECYDFLFETAVRMKQLGLGVIPKPPRALALGSENGHTRKRKLESASVPDVVLLDIEGTLSPVSYRTDTLVPLIQKELKDYMNRTFEDALTQTAIQAIRDIALGSTENGKEIVPPGDMNKEAIIDGVCNWLKKSGNKKIEAMNALQGGIVLETLQAGKLSPPLFEDVSPVLQQLKDHGVKVCIYSSLRADAQRRFFKCTQDGDISRLISGFFDTTCGSKYKAGSYQNISQFVSPTPPDRVVFVTDIVDEAKAAEESGLKCVLAKRPGNAEIGDDHGFRVITSLETLSTEWFGQ